jgi:hypothetical protein
VDNVIESMAVVELLDEMGVDEGDELAVDEDRDEDTLATTVATDAAAAAATGTVDPTEPDDDDDDDGATTRARLVLANELRLNFMPDF